MKKDTLKYICGLLLFGSNGFVSSHIALSSDAIVLLRSVLGTILLTVLFFASGHRTRIYLQNRKDSVYVMISGIAMAADWLLLFEAYKRLGVSLSILINYCGPFIVIALSPLVLREKLQRRKILALLIAFIGVVLISGSAAIDGIDLLGLLCAVLSAFAYACMVLANKKSTAVTGMENAMLQLFTTMVVAALFSAVTGRIPTSIDRGSILAILWLGLVNTGLGCYLYSQAQGRTLGGALCGRARSRKWENDHEECPRQDPGRGEGEAPQGHRGRPQAGLHQGGQVYRRSVAG